MLVLCSSSYFNFVSKVTFSCLCSAINNVHPCDFFVCDVYVSTYSRTRFICGCCQVALTSIGPSPRATNIDSTNEAAHAVVWDDSVVL